MKFESAVWRGGDGGEVEGRRGVDGLAGVGREGSFEGCKVRPLAGDEVLT
jgi:hypothetical protein